MGGITTFEDILAWQRAKILVLSVYQDFRVCKDYSFRDQIQRASVSIMNNIAEGYERRSNNEFRNFLYIAKGSSGEVRSMLHLALDLKYITNAQYDRSHKDSVEISKMISGLIKTL